MSSYTTSYPGIAAATGTRLDSAAKHTMACKVGTDLLSCWCENQHDARNHLHTQKMKYCMHKNELALNVGQPLNDISLTGAMPCKAYPVVVTTLGDISTVTKNILLWLYHSSVKGRNFLQNKQKIREMSSEKGHDLQRLLRDKNSGNVEKEKVVRELKDLPYFLPQGYALGMAYASNLSGDTVGTVLIGGMITVMNGAFEIRTGQMVQWYFDFEDAMFYRKNTKGSDNMTIPVGTRIELNFASQNKLPDADSIAQLKLKTRDINAVSEQEQSRKSFHERELGSLDAFPLGGISAAKRHIFLPKPYVVRSDGEEHYGDKIRVFAKCVNGARPFEMVDLMLMTQSL